MIEVIRRWSISILGATIASFSVVMSIKADFGLNAYNALLYNLSEATGLTIGLYSWISGFLLIIFNKIVSKKKKFNWSAMIVSFLFGSIIDFFYASLAGNVVYESIIIRLVLFPTMIVVSGVGISLIIFSGVISPVEEYQFAIKKMFRTSLANAKVYSDISFFVIALLVSLFSHNGLGQISIGTVVVTVSTGRVIGMTLQTMNRSKSRNLVQV